VAKVIVKDEKSLKDAKQKLRGIIDFRKTKYGVIATKAKWSKKKKK